VLRGLRQELKTLAAASESVKALRETIKQAELMAERENLQRWQAWAWASSSDEQRVVNVVEKSSDAANWLLNQLLLGQSGHQDERGAMEQNERLYSLQTLTCQLDPRQGAR